MVLIGTDSRERFRKRKITYVGILLAPLGVLALVTAIQTLLKIPLFSLWFWLLNAVAIGITFLRFRFELFCPKCKRHTPWNEKWVCSFCSEQNEKRSFLDYCGHCRTAPRSFECLHCKELIFLDGSGGDKEHPARFVMPAIPPTIPQSAEVQRKQEIEEREHAILVAKLNAEQAQAEAQLNLAKNKKKTPEEEWQETKEQHLSVDIIYERELKLAEAECGGDRAKFERRKILLEHWREQRSL